MVATMGLITTWRTPTSPILTDGPIPGSCRCTWSWVGGRTMRLKQWAGSCSIHETIPTTEWDKLPVPWGAWHRGDDREPVSRASLFAGLSVDEDSRECACGCQEPVDGRQRYVNRNHYRSPSAHNGEEPAAVV